MYNKKALSTAVSKLGSAQAPAKKRDKIYTNKDALSPFVSSEGFKQGPPPAGTNYRIPSDTLYNPTPYKIKAVSDNNITQYLEPGDTTSKVFPGANYVDEYPAMAMGGNRGTNRALFYKEGGEYYDDELTQEEIDDLIAQGYVVEDLPKAQNGSFIDGPNPDQNTDPTLKYVGNQNVKTLIDPKNPYSGYTTVEKYYYEKIPEETIKLTPKPITEQNLQDAFASKDPTTAIVKRYNTKARKWEEVKVSGNSPEVEEDRKRWEYAQKNKEYMQQQLGNRKQGGALLTKKVTCKNCGWKWDAADGGDDVTTCHKCGGQGLVHAQTGGQIYKYADRPEARYKKDDKGNWLINLPSTNGQFVPMNDPSGKRAGELNEKATLDPSQFRRQYDPMTDVKPQVAENTVIPNAPKADNTLIDRAVQQKQAERAIVGEKIRANPLLTEEQKLEIITSPQKLDENVHLAYEKGPDEVKAYTPDKPQGFWDKAGDIASNPMTSLGFLMRGEAIPDYMQRDMDRGTFGYYSNGELHTERNPLDFAVADMTGLSLVNDARSAYKGLSEGDYTQAGLGLLSFIPGFGEVRKVSNTVDVAADANRAVNTAQNVNKGLEFSGPQLHYAKDKDVVIGALTQRGKNWDNLGANGAEFLHPDMIHYHGTYSGRPLVEVKMPDGSSEMFYKSSGWAGKAGEGTDGTTAGMWQVYGGHAGDANNWFIKDKNYINYYGSKTFADMAKNMDNALMNKYNLSTTSDLDNAFNFQNRFGNQNSYTPIPLPPPGYKGYKKGGEKKYSRSLEAKNRLFVENKLTKKKKSKKNKIFDPKAKYYQDGGEKQVECDDDGRCYETDEAQKMLDITHQTITNGLAVDRHIAQQVWNGTPANQAWQALGLKTPDQLTGDKNAFSCSTYSNLGNKACDNSIQYEDILSNARMKNAVNAGRTPYRKVATYPNNEFLYGNDLKPGQLISFMGNGTNHMVKYYGDDFNGDQRAFMQSNGDPTDWSFMTNYGWLPNVPATVYEYAPHYDEIQALEEKARTNPTYVPGTSNVGSLPLRPIGNLATTDGDRVLPPNLEDLGVRQFGGIPTLPLNKGRQVLRDWVYGADIGMLQEADGGYMDLELTDEEIQRMRDLGHYVEEY